MTGLLLAIAAGLLAVAAIGCVIDLLHDIDEMDDFADLTVAREHRQALARCARRCDVHAYERTRR